METATRDDAGRHEHLGVAGTLLARWPTLVGLAVLAWSAAGGPDAHVTAMIIILAAMCYLAAAALGSRRSGWVVAGAATVAVVIAMATALDAIVVLLVAAAAFAVYGLLRGRRIDRRELGIQAAGFVVFAAIALTAMSVGPVAAAYLAAAAAIGHGVWDIVHYRRDKVVTRSLTEFCAVLDLGLGVLLLAVTWAAL
ncbi:conserved hypothetical protein [Beutenbergia cavernae DSM 12333]|uniref:Uncharacterized protein n=1 Tax=Beutenbergia cavernae (strain ATCC BAA-8 / DSM 12333 / CCUG 43141 / JCM 11478 / NBRC 16432 / NCIMB 13614 / HKI 0122) TaxID=471853 RepID=C5BXV6_BEUC1|nr:hypothetical protein [Beutenbergia cavernae]ACQ78850.1 conserved hypothetical protein [Beutenbergia cavernae DSM 12333]